MKRGVGRGAGANGNGHAVFPPGPVGPVTQYRQPPPPGRSGLGLLRRILIGTLLVILALALGIGGGAYLWFHQSLNAVKAHSTAVKVAQKELDIPLPGQPVTALVLGEDQRPGETATGSRSDTIMLIRADPKTKTISLMSFPRDLVVPIYGKHVDHGPNKINSAFAVYGPEGSLETVKALTGIPISYLITVDFHGFKEIVDQFGGVWMDIDRRYYNPPGDGYAAINIEPGYQLLTGGAALNFVRFRHTDSDFVRVARQQEFVHAFKADVAQHFNPLDLPKIVKTITQNIEVGGNPSFGSVIQYALLAATLPPGHIIQVSINGVSGYSDVTASSQAIQDAVSQFVNPDVGVSKVANATALGTKIKTKAPPANKTTVLALNGNGIQGAAANASYLLTQRGYISVLPPNGIEPNAPKQTYFRTQIYYDKQYPGAQAAAKALQKLIVPSDVGPLPLSPALRALDPKAMLVVVLGQTFHNQITPAPVTPAVAPHQAASVRYDPTPALDLLRPLTHRVPFPLEVPTVLDQNSEPDTLPSDKPVYLYHITKKNKAIRLVFHNGNSFWGIEETDDPNPPILADKSFQHDLDGREFDLYYSGPDLHMIVLHAHGATYWVVNSLLNDLSNETMIAIAKGLKPITTLK
ncbi:MAG TPA: LCP family protein [Gaiellaceae bacterium]|nr:LCP family protein [Gaiellaceae bacterium]